MARITALSPGQSPPPVTMRILMAREDRTGGARSGRRREARELPEDHGPGPPLDALSQLVLRRDDDTATAVRKEQEGRRDLGAHAPRRELPLRLPRSQLGRRHRVELAGARRVV